MTFDDYQGQAHISSRVDSQPNPAETLAHGILEETLEAFCDDGQGRIMSYLYLPEVGLDDELKQTTAKEFGDVMWYISEIESRRGASLGQTALMSLGDLKPSIDPSDLTIELFDKYALYLGSGYGVVNHKWLAMLDSERPSIGDGHRLEMATLKARTSPGYVLQRVFSRLVRLTENSKVFPPGNADFDEEALIARSPSDALLVMSHVAQTLLGYTLSEISEFNLSKLRRRLANDTVLSGEDPDRSG